MRILRDPKACYGCRVCELVCSYHHRGAFSSGGGSIQVSKDRRSGKIEWLADATCDGCEREGEPLCVKYCSYGALSEVQG